MFEAVFSGCHSRADYYRRLISVDNTFTPQEMVALWQHHTRLPDDIQKLMGSTLRMMLAGGRQARRFRRQALADHVTLYTNGASAGDKSLLLCFCGNSDRMMMPIPAFLQFIDDAAFDVITLRPPSRCNYLDGITGYAPSLPAVLERLVAEHGLRAYRDIRTLGCSAGGAAALYAGVLLGAKRALSFGGSHPSLVLARSERHQQQGFNGHEFDIDVREGASGPTELLAVFGALNAADEAGARSLQQALPTCRLVPVEDLDKHVILAEMVRQDTLAPFLTRYVFADTLPSTPAP